MIEVGRKTASGVQGVISLNVDSKGGNNVNIGSVKNFNDGVYHLELNEGESIV